jgi:hypothetical protein
MNNVIKTHLIENLFSYEEFKKYFTDEQIEEYLDLLVREHLSRGDGIRILIEKYLTIEVIIKNK